MAAPLPPLSARRLGAATGRPRCSSSQRATPRGGGLRTLRQASPHRVRGLALPAARDLRGCQQCQGSGGLSRRPRPRLIAAAARTAVAPASWVKCRTCRMPAVASAMCRSPPLRRPRPLRRCLRWASACASLRSLPFSCLLPQALPLCGTWALRAAAEPDAAAARRRGQRPLLSLLRLRQAALQPAPARLPRAPPLSPHVPRSRVL